MNLIAPRSVCFAAAFALSLCAAPVAHAQLDDFAAIPVTAPLMKLEHSVQYVQEGNVVRAFSGITRKWSTMQSIFGSPIVTLHNEHLIVQDGPIFYGYSSRTCRFTALFPLGGSGVLLPAGSAQSWQSVVLDGGTVHIYSAVTGAWQTQSFATAPTIVIGRLCVIIDDGAGVFGISAYFGTPMPLTVPGATAFGAYGNVGLATSPGAIHGFSAHRNTWSSMSLSGPPSVTSGFTAQPGFVCIQDGATISFFSGLTGAFTTLPVPPSASISLHRMCAIVVDGNTVYGYSAPLGASASFTAAAAPSVTMSHFFALVTAGSDVYAYSTESNQFAPPLHGSFTFTLSQTTAFATPTTTGTPGFAYSSLTDQWFGAPIADAQAVTAANAIVLVDPAGGLYGFAPRGSTWAHLPVPPLTGLYQATTPQGPGVLIAQDGNTLHTFSPRSGEWRSINTVAGVAAFKGHWNAAILHDGFNAYAYGVFNDRWSTIPLAGPVVSINAQVESASVFAGGEVVGYTAFGQLVLTADYPDYWRVISQGGRLRLDLAGEPNSPTILLLGLAPASIPTAYGTLRIAPANLLVIGVPTLSGDGLFDMTLTVPVNPALSGFEVHFQAAVNGPLGLYLTNSAIARIL